jgi:hypothetical protein
MRGWPRGVLCNAEPFWFQQLFVLSIERRQNHKEGAREPFSQLSGMSGGPVFWSDGTACGLLGFVKEALDVKPAPGVETLPAGPKVDFICQRSSYAHPAEQKQKV